MYKKARYQNKTDRPVALYKQRRTDRRPPLCSPVRQGYLEQTLAFAYLGVFSRVLFKTAALGLYADIGHRLGRGAFEVAEASRGDAHH